MPNAWDQRQAALPDFLEQLGRLLPQVGATCQRCRDLGHSFDVGCGQVADELGRLSSLLDALERDHGMAVADLPHEARAAMQEFFDGIAEAALMMTGNPAEGSGLWRLHRAIEDLRRREI